MKFNVKDINSAIGFIQSYYAKEIGLEEYINSVSTFFQKLLQRELKEDFLYSGITFSGKSNLFISELNFGDYIHDKSRQRIISTSNFLSILRDQDRVLNLTDQILKVSRKSVLLFYMKSAEETEIRKMAIDQAILPISLNTYVLSEDQISGDEYKNFTDFFPPQQERPDQPMLHDVMEGLKLLNEGKTAEKCWNFFRIYGYLSSFYDQIYHYLIYPETIHQQYNGLLLLGTKRSLADDEFATIQLILFYLFSETLIEKVAHIEAAEKQIALLRNLTDIFNHRTKRSLENLEVIKDEVTNARLSIDSCFFDLIFDQVKESQSNLFDLSMALDQKLNYSLKNAKKIQLKQIVLYFYLRRILSVSYRKVYSDLYSANYESFKLQLYDKFRTLILNVRARGKFDEFLDGLEFFDKEFQDIITKLHKYEPECQSERAFLKCECADDIVMNIPRDKIFWGYFSSIMDELFNNAVGRTEAIEFALKNDNLWVTAHKLYEQPPEGFIKKYKVNNEQPLKQGDAIHPIYYTTGEKAVSYGIFGIRIASEVLCWDFGIGYFQNEKSIKFNFSFREKEILERSKHKTI